MLRKPAYFVIALALFLVLPSLAVAQDSASPAEVASQPEAPVSDADLEAILGLTPEVEELPWSAESPIPMACPMTYFKCVRCTNTTRRLCEYWECSHTLKGCGPCTTACPI